MQFEHSESIHYLELLFYSFNKIIILRKSFYNTSYVISLYYIPTYNIIFRDNNIVCHFHIFIHHEKFKVMFIMI